MSQIREPHPRPAALPLYAVFTDRYGNHDDGRERTLLTNRHNGSTAGPTLRVAPTKTRPGENKHPKQEIYT